jgi:hypothetical protein
MSEDPNQPLGSAVAFLARQAAIRAADDGRRPAPSEAELAEIAAEAERKNTFGFDYKTDSRGQPIQQGIGSPGHETANHYASLRRYEGQAAYDKAVRELYRRDPVRAKALGLPEPARAGA